MTDIEETSAHETDADIIESGKGLKVGLHDKASGMCLLRLMRPSACEVNEPLKKVSDMEQKK
jgi:hypothetical protein